MKYVFKNEFTIAIFAAILFIPFIGHVHLFDWDEINFAESAREMIATGNYFDVQINYSKFTEKPPLFFWMQVLSMKAFGINEFAARFPNAVCGILTLVLLFRIGKKIYNENLARIWVLTYLGTLVTFLYFKSGIIDPWFNLFIFLAIYHYYLLITYENSKTKQAVLVGLFLGLAVLTKGPVAILIAMLCMLTYVVLNKGKFNISTKNFILILLSCLVVCFAWFGIDLLKNGPAFIIEFTQRQVAIFSTSDAGHGQPFFYHWWVLLVGCFPASIFFISGQMIQNGNKEQKEFKLWMVILFWVTLLLFSIVKTKIIHYSSLCWFPLTFIAALFIYELWEGRIKKIHTLLKILFALVGVTLGLIITVLPIVLQYKNKWVHYIKDDFAKGNLQANVQWYWIDGVGGLLLLFSVVYFLCSKKIKLKTQLLYASVTVCCFFTAVLIAPKVEAISQRANIEFFESKQNEDCYIDTWGYKSYAHFFYSKKQPANFDSTKNMQWMLYGKIDKPVYISTKIQNKKILDTVQNLKMLYQKNGFVFYNRLP
ncbi:MAG TPA: glycosyltransferase family 39 protein [Chitinophagaceae bacterium]|nr:glycosyltransferase family 39 protein [Chitinophagaceae bacterium]HNE93664.1 glycosyltransferase family 39 protein [Chitinophagaceae bacterium]HNM33685.1 glycosyltransferase family 39 protein [Chitinophagaceae bacterium]